MRPVTNAWKVVYCGPHTPWDEAQLIGGQDEHSEPTGHPRILLIGLSHDLELANLARRLSHAPATVRVLLLDLLDALPTWRTSDSPVEAFDVGYCRAYQSDRAMHYHFNRTFRQSESWGRVAPGARRYAAEQVDSLFWASISRYRVAGWVNSPWSVRLAENKLAQLDVAEGCGFLVPRTLVSSRRDDVRAYFKSSPNGFVTKSLESPILEHGEGSSLYQYTCPVDSAVLEDTQFPLLYQERIVADEELRVTVVAGQIFAARLPSARAGGTADWRLSPANHTSFEPTLLPDEVRKKVLDVMASLDLQVGGFDLLSNDDGIYFLEVNPSCAFLWLERSTNLQISGALTRLLVSNAPDW